jgi:predicted MFS family arabinose efflux permease
VVSAPAAAAPGRRGSFAVAALASATFSYVTAEGFPVGLLSQLSAGLHVRVTAVGLLVTIYAAVAGLAAVPVTAWVDRRGRRQVVVSAVALLAVSQLVIAAAPDYAVVLVARVACALGHGVFWSVLAPVAARLAPPGRSGRATATVFAGNSVALVAGIPAATALGQAVGWRVSAAALGVAGLASAAALRVTMPVLPAQPSRQRLAAVPGLLRRPPLFAVCAVTALLVIGDFAAYTYITALIRRDADLHGFAIAAVLLVYGLAGLVSIVLVGRHVDRRLRLTVVACTAGVAVALAVLASLARHSVPVTVAAVALWGAAFTALPACLQSAVLRVAPDSADSASALYVVAFQIGIGGGALAGSILVGAGQLGILPVAGALLAVVSTAVVLLARHAFPPAAPSPLPVPEPLAANNDSTRNTSHIATTGVIDTDGDDCLRAPDTATDT